MAHTYSENDGHLITEKTALEWIAAYKSRHGKAALRSYFFGTHLFKKLLDHPEAVGIRVCLGYDGATLQMILVATRQDGSRIWLNEAAALNSPGSGDAGDGGIPCPPHCPSGDD
jgi:hypothetical protein